MNEVIIFEPFKTCFRCVVQLESKLNYVAMHGTACALTGTKCVCTVDIFISSLYLLVVTVWDSISMMCPGGESLY